MGTSRENEYAFATMHGLMFAKVIKDEKGFYKFQQLEDAYLKGMYIRSAIEYQPDKFIVCINENNYIYLVDRKTKECNYSIENPSGMDKILAVKKIPGFDYQTFPYLVLRDQQTISLLDVKKMKGFVIYKGCYKTPYSHENWLFYQTTLLDVDIDRKT